MGTIFKIEEQRTEGTLEEIAAYNISFVAYNNLDNRIYFTCQDHVFGYPCQT